MKNKIINILNWVLGMVLCSFGVCLCTKAGFGLSMIGAPPYIIHVWLRESFPWFTQGTSEYVWEALILFITIIIVRRFRLKYLLSFGVAVLLGLMIDFWLYVFGGNGVLEDMTMRIVFLVFGILLTSIAVSLYFRTTLPLQVYELTVVEVSDKYKIKQGRLKWITDISYLVISIVLSFALTGGLTGIGIGTVIITVVNAPLITLCGKMVDCLEKTDATS